MKQMQKLQKQMAQAQEELNQTEYVGSSQSDLVQVTVNGKRQVLSVSIKPEAVDGDDVELLQDLVLMATNRALEQAEKANEQTMGQFTRGLNIPGF
jgi:DNA-binding protein, ybaB/ebfC family